MRQDFIEQLIPGDRGVDKIKVKVFGAPGVGKSTLIDTCQTGLISGFLRRSFRGSARKKKKSETSNFPKSRDIDLCPYVMLFQVLHNQRQTAKTLLPTSLATPKE